MAGLGAAVGLSGVSAAGRVATGWKDGDGLRGKIGGALKGAGSGALSMGVGAVRGIRDGATGKNLR